MFEWFWHLLHLKSPREMRELDRQYRQDMSKLKIQMARIFAMQITDEAKREELLAEIDKADQEAQI